MTYMRFTAFYFDLAKYDDLMSLMNSLNDRFKDIAGLMAGRAARVNENRIMVAAAYNDKASADAADQELRGELMSRFAAFMTEEPIIREGDVVWSIDKESTLEDSDYFRFTRVVFDPSRFDEMMSAVTPSLEGFKDVAGLKRIRIARIMDDRVMAMARYGSKSEADAGTRQVQQVLSGMAEYLTGEETLIREGNLVWRFDK